MNFTRPHWRWRVAAIWLASLPLGCGGPATGPGNANPVTADVSPLEAQTLVVAPSPWPAIVRTQGSLVADEVVIVGTKVAGRVAEVHVDLGDRVEQGAILVGLDQQEFRLQVVQAEAQLTQSRTALGLRKDDPLSKLNPENAPPVREALAVWDETRTQRERVFTLRQQNAVTQAEYDQAVAAERVAEARHASAFNSVNEKIAQIDVRTAELELANQRLTDSQIAAPFEGQIQTRHVAPGAYVQIGDPIATLVRTHLLRFRGTIPERQAQSLAMGQEVNLTIESVSGVRRAKVDRIAPAVDPLNRALVFEALMDNQQGELRSGLFAEAEVVLDHDAQALSVPGSAVIEFAGAEKVWKVVDGRCHEQAVKTGRRHHDRVEILAGLSSQDEILLDAGLGRAARTVSVMRN